MLSNSTLRLIWTLMLCLLAFGCAKTSVRETSELSVAGLPRPERVLIYNFAVSPQDVQQNSSIFATLERRFANSDQTAEEIELGREVADALATELTRKIADMGLRPLRADQNMPVTPGSILVTGHFVKVDEGNRLRRNVIGLGLGQSSIDSDVRILAPGRSGLQELIAFEAHADSGEMPGAAVLGPAGVAAGAGTAAVVATNVAVGGMKSYRSDAAQQAKQLADKIGAELAKYFAEQGWIDPNLAK
jgi:hypothetical protein